MQASLEEIIEHVDTINAIPETHISHEDRAFYVARARQGLDVYAYTSGLEPHYNIWDTETRIACAPLITSWAITGTLQEQPQLWRVFVERNGERRSVQFHVHLHPIHDRANDKEHYEDRASRVIRSAVQHINLFNDDIDKLNGCHF